MPLGKVAAAFFNALSAVIRISFALEPGVWKRAIPMPGLPSARVLEP
jgi:hypothetical protein